MPKYTKECPVSVGFSFILVDFTIFEPKDLENKFYSLFNRTILEEYGII